MSTYDYIPFSAQQRELQFISPKRTDLIKCLQLVEQYNLRGFYNYPLDTSVEQVKKELLIPYLDKLLRHPSILGHFFFINRITPTIILLEVIIFSVSDLPNVVLNGIMFSPKRQLLTGMRVQDEE